MSSTILLRPTVKYAEVYPESLRRLREGKEGTRSLFPVLQ